VFTLESYEIGHLRAARRTPGSPKVNQNYLALIVPQPHRASINILEFK